MHYTVEQCSIIVLAAGMSSRLGRPKQLLNYKGKSLLQHAVHEAMQTTMRPVIVVIGANSDVVKKELKDLDIEVAENERWIEGMSTSLHRGLVAAKKLNKDVDGIIFMVSDQPFVSASLLNNLLKTQHETGLPIIASDYGDKLGTPVLFHKSFFSELMKLSGDTGARKLIKKNTDVVATVAFFKGNIDIDTKEDYEGLAEQ